MFTAQPLRQEWTDDLPIYWNDNSPFNSHFLNSMSLTFPDGELFFIKSINQFRDQITDQTQLNEIDEFIKQETWHRYAHTQYNNWIESKGYPAKEIEAEMHIFWDRAWASWSPIKKLAGTVCVEHITAINSELSLKYRNSFKRMHPHFEQIWRWHSIEEIEHKAVAMDIWNQVNGPLWLRRLAMIYVLFYYIIITLKNTMRLLKADNQLYKWQTVKDAWAFLFKKDSGLFRGSIPYIIDFMRADWHPDQSDHSLFLKYKKV